MGRRSWRKLRPEYERLKDAVKYAPDKVKSFEGMTQRHGEELAVALEDPANRQTLEYGKLQAKFPDLIPPGPITARLASYKVGDAKVSAVVAVGAKYERMGARLQARKEAHVKVIREHMEEQVRITDPYASQGRQIPPDVDAKYQALNKKILAEIDARDGVIAKQEGLANRQRAEVERVLRVKDGADITAPDVPAGFKDEYGEPWRPPDGPLRGRADAAVAWMKKTVARGDESTANVPLGQGDDSTRGFYGIKHIGLSPHDSPSTVVHELSHVVDNQFKTGPHYVGSRSKEFLAHRIGDEAPVDMSEKFGGYDKGEMGRKDKFDSAFEERYAYYVGKEAAFGSTEVISMGIQKVYDDPVGFAKKDPEYFKFVAGIMDGSLR